MTNITTIEKSISPSHPDRQAGGQYMTPDWAAEELIHHYFGDLTLCDSVLEPSCGEGAFLRALPEYVPACGIEIDPVLAARAIASTGRKVIVGDFRSAEIQLRPTAIIGNPPFQAEIVSSFLDRAWEMLAIDGRVGFILPCGFFQTASTVCKLNERWGIHQDLLPRNLFSRLSMPICFAVLTKGSGRKLFGFSLFHEHHAVTKLQRRYRALLAQGERSSWVAVTRAALESLGGSASLSQMYREIEGERPTDNQFWRAKVRQTLQRIAIRSGPGFWKLPPNPTAIAA